MLKWLHRGFVTLLMATAVGAVSANVCVHSQRSYPTPTPVFGYFPLLLLDNHTAAACVGSVYMAPDMHTEIDKRSRFAGMTFIYTKTQRLCGATQHIDQEGNRITLENVMIHVPYWLIAVTAFTYPAIFFCRSYRRRRRQIAPNHCHQCNYNLTGNQSGICPECGEAVEAST